MKEKNESTVVSIRMSKVEKEYLNQAADELEMSMSEYVLMKVFKEDKASSIYLEKISDLIEEMDYGEEFCISELTPTNWKIFSKKTKKKILKQVYELINEGEIDAEILQHRNKDLYCKKKSWDLRDAFLNSSLARRLDDSEDD
ncbi:hypothetical protein [Paenibacillus sp. FSL W8-1287]|uniref:hypothetical protein n=1 Tax=Paenibacillus sp. FSL W8-1287 TaxID=2954653 RepID=UPI0030D5B9AD